LGGKKYFNSLKSKRDFSGEFREAGFSGKIWERGQSFGCDWDEEQRKTLAQQSSVRHLSEHHKNPNKQKKNASRSRLLSQENGDPRHNLDSQGTRDDSAKLHPGTAKLAGQNGRLHKKGKRKILRPNSQRNLPPHAIRRKNGGHARFSFCSGMHSPIRPKLRRRRHPKPPWQPRLRAVKTPLQVQSRLPQPRTLSRPGPIANPYVQAPATTREIQKWKITGGPPTQQGVMQVYPGLGAPRARAIMIKIPATQPSAQ